MSSFLDRIKAAATKVEVELAPGIDKISIIIERKAEATAKAIAGAVTPEVEEYMGKLEAAIESHASKLAALVEKHADTAAGMESGAGKASVF